MTAITEDQFDAAHDAYQDVYDGDNHKASLRHALEAAMAVGSDKDPFETFRTGFCVTQSGGGEKPQIIIEYRSVADLHKAFDELSAALATHANSRANYDHGFGDGYENGYKTALRDAANSPAGVVCETCDGIGAVDERLGGEATSRSDAPCPDCDGRADKAGAS